MKAILQENSLRSRLISLGIVIEDTILTSRPLVFIQKNFKH